MKISHGTSRTVLQIGGLVFKFPQYGQFWQIAKSVIIRGLRGQWSRIPEDAAGCILYFLSGMVANLTEYAVCLYTESRMLAPVYFSIGFVSIQKYLEGPVPHHLDIYDRLEQMPEKARLDMRRGDKHAWGESNFRKTDIGIQMIDYGDSLFSENISLSRFISIWYVQMQDAFCPLKPPD